MKKRLTSVEFRKGENEVQSKSSLIINISSSEQALLAEMKQKTRYNISLAIRKGVKIRISDEVSDMESFWQLVKQTSSRDGFAPHPKVYYKKMFEILNKDQTIRLFLAEYKNKIVATNLVSFYGKVCTYLHGASSDMYREVMPTYLLQWQTILEAKKIGYQFYDFGGVNGSTFNDPKWQGITRFKSGFATKTKPQEYLGSFELILNPVVYSAYKFIKQIRG